MLRKLLITMNGNCASGWYRLAQITFHKTLVVIDCIYCKWTNLAGKSLQCKIYVLYLRLQLLSFFIVALCTLILMGLPGRLGEIAFSALYSIVPINLWSLFLKTFHFFHKFSVTLHLRYKFLSFWMCKYFIHFKRFKKSTS